MVDGGWEDFGCYGVVALAVTQVGAAENRLDEVPRKSKGLAPRARK